MKQQYEIFRDNFQNYKQYNIPKAQLIVADIPYNIGNNAYGSNPQWYVDGEYKNGESKKANSTFFNTDVSFNIEEFMHFASQMLKKQPKKIDENHKPPCMIVFCSFEQQFTLIQTAKKYGFKHYIPLVFIKNSSPQVLKANMKIVGACEYALVIYKDKLPKFNNNGKMILNWFLYTKDDKSIPKIHPTQKPVNLLKRLIEIFTDKGDVVLDPCCGSGSTIRTSVELNRIAYGFEIDKNFYEQAKNKMMNNIKVSLLEI